MPTAADTSRVNAKSQDNFDALSAAFRDSFTLQQGAAFHPSLQITDLRSRDAGRGIVATADIPADTALFIIPRDYIISVDNSELIERVPELFSSVYDDEDDTELGSQDDVKGFAELPRPWLNLVLVMLYEYLHRDLSKWRAYWGVLPEHFDTLMFWSAEELEQLQSSESRGKIGKEDADAMFRSKVLPAVKRYEEVFYPPGSERLGEEDLMRLAHRMGSLIMAYAFDLEEDPEVDGQEEGEDGWTEDQEGKMAMGMVPMADMLNADARFNAHLEHGDKELTMKSLREIKTGDEVLNYYGPLPNSDLLRRYGYTSSLHARYDVVEISWDLVKDAICQVFGSFPEPLADEEELEEGFVLERDSGDPDESGAITKEAVFTAFPEELIQQVTTFASAALGVGTEPNEAQRRQLKKSFLQVMAIVLPLRLAGYGSSIEEDEEILKQTAIPARRRMAVNVRLGEKLLLREAEQLVSRLLLKYTKTSKDSRDERPSKKQKRVG